MKKNIQLSLILSFLVFSQANAFSLDDLANSAIKKINKEETQQDEKLEEVVIKKDKINYSNNKQNNIKNTNKTKENIVTKKENNSIISKIKTFFEKKENKIVKKITSKEDTQQVNKKIYDTIKINLDKKIQEKLITNNKISKEELKKIIYKLYIIKRNIQNAFKNKDYQKVLNELDQLNKLKYISMNIKENFYIYSFWKILLDYTNRKDLYLPKIKKESFKLLSRVLSYIDVNRDFNTKLASNVYKLITHARMYNGDDLIDLLRTYFPYGLNNEILFYKLLKIMNSDYIKKYEFVNIYGYLKENFYDYFSNNSMINFKIINEYFKLLIKFSYATDFINANNQRILNNLLYQNPLNSELYYYKALYYKYFEDYDKMKEYLLKSIRFNANNNKAWFELISYYIKNRKKFIKKALNFYKVKYEKLDNINYSKLPENVKNAILKYDKMIFNQINFYISNTVTEPKYLNKILLMKANLYFIEGTNFLLPDRLLKSANIDYSLHKCNLITNIINILPIVSKSKKFDQKIKELYDKCTNNNNNENIF